METQTKPVRVMLIEDSVEYRRILCLALDDLPDMQLAGQFGTTEVALRSLAALSVGELPDVILLDLRLPGLGGIDAIPHIHAVAPAARIIVLSQSEESEDIFRAISAGVSGSPMESVSWLPARPRSTGTWRDTFSKRCGLAARLPPPS